MGTAQNAPPELYSLRWHSYHSNLSAIFWELQSKEGLVDVTLSCEGQFIRAHRLILSACSTYFQNVFELHPQASPMLIVLNDVKFTDLQLLIQFMYNGEVKVSDVDMHRFLSLGKTLQVKGLCSVDLENQVNQVKTTVVNKEQKDIKTEPRKRKNAENSNVSISIPEENPTKTTLQHFNESVPSKSVTTTDDQSKRSPSAFMAFANKWRQKLALEHPTDTNKDISIKLSNMWKSLPYQEKDAFYEEAGKAHVEFISKSPAVSRNVVKKKARHLSDDSVIVLDSKDPLNIDGSNTTNCT